MSQEGAVLDKPSEGQEVTQEVQGILGRAVAATKQTAPDRAKALLGNLTKESKAGRLKWNVNVSKSISQAVDEIDRLLSLQLSEVLHAPEFQKLEGSWRGLKYLVDNSDCSSSLKIRVFNAEKKELNKDFVKASEFDQSHVWKKIYESEFGSAGGSPYGIMVGDYEISTHPDDINFVREMSHVAAASFCPFITAPASTMLGLDSWEDINVPRDLRKVMESVEYAAWNQYRESEDSAFVTMTLPRTMIRHPYGAKTSPVESFNYEEFNDEFGNVYHGQVSHDRYCWTNSSYILAAKICNAFNDYGFCTAIRGYENGGRVDELPSYTYIAKSGDLQLKCPTEAPITDRREKELSDLGFLPICHYKNTTKAVFFGAQTNNRPKKYDTPEASANSEISARLPFVLASSRFAHYLKVMARDKIGSFQEVADMQRWMNRWIHNYVNTNEFASASQKARYPLKEAAVKVEEVPGSPGKYHAIVWLRPWMQFEELTASMRLVAELPSAAK